jgi:hypothetical protein
MHWVDQMTLSVSRFGKVLMERGMVARVLGSVNPL